MAMRWEPCSDCQKRLAALNSTKQTHIAGLTEIEVLSDVRDFAGKGSWSRLTRLDCVCGLTWTRSQVQGGALMQYESEFSPEPTGEQASSVSMPPSN